MKKLTASFLVAVLLMLPAMAWAAVATKYMSARLTVGGTSKVLFQYATPTPAGAVRIKGNGVALRVVNETPGSVLWCNPNVDSTLAATAVASDATPNQRRLDDDNPEFRLDSFDPQKLQCVSDSSTVVFWEITEQ